MSTTTVTAPPRARGCCTPVREPNLSPAAATDLSMLLKALAHPIRVRIVDALRSAPEPVCQCDFAATFDPEVPQPTLSRYLKTLVDEGVIATTRKGVWSYYYIPADSRLKEIIAWLT